MTKLNVKIGVVGGVWISHFLLFVSIKEFPFLGENRYIDYSMATKLFKHPEITSLFIWLSQFDDPQIILTVSCFHISADLPVPISITCMLTHDMHCCQVGTLR